jgi:hypothetical protein
MEDKELPEAPAPVAVKAPTYFPWDGKDPRSILGVTALQCQSCKIVFGDVGTGVCPCCRFHYCKPV